MTALAASRDLSLGRPIAFSAVLHVVAAAGFLLARSPAPVPMPPTYRVSLVAAPPGPRATGVVQPAPTPAPTPVAPAATPRSRTVPPAPVAAKPAAKPVPKKGAAPPPKLATPSATTAPAPASTAPAPRAGGGPTGGKGADVANVQVDGIAFPYPGYLENVVRQIALRFKPGRGGALTAVVAFLIRRDGSVTGIRLTTRSGVYSFDTEAMGAVDAAAQARVFGPLPQGFTDDVLPVIFSFDPRLIR